MSSVALVRSVTAVFIASLLAGCAVPSRGRAGGNELATAAVASASAWASTLIAAQSDVERGRHAEADRRLREFAERTAPSPEATETLYWRAVFMLDPASGASSPSAAGAASAASSGSPAGPAREALVLLGRYLEAGVPLTRRTEALVLQRIATALATPAAAPVTAPVTAQREPGPRPAANDAELKALKEELELTKAELERIRKRLAPAPTTPPPGFSRP